MAIQDLLAEIRAREGQQDPRRAFWYIIAAAALTAACGGEYVPEVYRLATKGLELEDRKVVQRRMKEAILKGSILYGVPRTAQGLRPLFGVIPESEIDVFSPRTDRINNKEADSIRAERGQRYFNMLWGPTAAQAHRDRAMKHCPDHYLLNIKTNYELWMSEDAILSPVETQMCNTALLICNNSPEQALWHLRGIVRHGGTLDQARLAQYIGLSVAKELDAKTGAVTLVDEVDEAEWELPK